MQKVNVRDIAEESWFSPGGKYGGHYKGVSHALGRDEQSTDLAKRHPFDVEISRLPPGKSGCPYHSHSAQWELYSVISGRGCVRHEGGRTAIEPGDSFLFPPGEAHELINDGAEDLMFYVIADNPIGESCYYPDSKKWMVRSPEKRLIRSEGLEYLDGEE